MSVPVLRNLNTTRLNRWRQHDLPRIHAACAELRPLADPDLRRRSLALRFRAKSGESLESLLPEAFGLVREAARRTLNIEHFDVQLLGGIAMFHGAIAEMETGEGKTLTATLPLYLYALPAKGSLLATVNDYLAERDAEWTRPIYEKLGLSLGVVKSHQQPAARRKAYHCDIAYGTAKEFGFDFLRDRLLLRENGLLGEAGNLTGNESYAGDRPVQRGSYFALVDEADSIFIDEARTPLIISGLPGEAERIAVACYQWAAASLSRFQQDEHYTYDHLRKTVELTAQGRQLVRTIPKPSLMDSVGMVDIYEYIERGLKVDREFERDRHYVVSKDEIVIVDESTGRLAEGRKWRAGIHQAIEAKENVEVTMDTGQAARITVQDFFLRFRHLAGMTGTAWTSARELKRIYKLRVIPIPTNRPKRRQTLPARIFATSSEKWAAIIEEIVRIRSTGRPVLVGTRSIDRSQLLSKLLSESNIEHQVLNAHHLAEEAEIVSHAGELGKVTVSTNMAGRGTDIKLGPGVDELGGLHVICTELHDSARIDRQLVGRCARQGDAGSTQQYMALDDDIIESAYGPKYSRRIVSRHQGRENLEKLGRLFRRAQDKVERFNFNSRRILLYHEKQRRKLQREMGQDPYLDSPE